MERFEPITAIPTGVRPTVFVFHKLLPSLSYSSTNYSPRRFERFLEALQKAGYFFGAGVGEEQGRARAVVTFDDGYQHLIDVLPPLMERFGLQPLIFVSTALIGQPNKWDYSYWLRPTPHLERRAIKKLSQLGVQFGSHGHLHADLTQFPARRMQVELRQSRDVLADITGQKIAAISYPFGRVNEAVLGASEMAGFTTGYTMNWPSDSDRPLAQGRIPIYAYDSLLSIKHKLSNGPANRIERLKARVTNGLSGGTVLLNRLRRFK